MIIMLVPILVFGILIVLGREELGFKWVLILLALAAAMYGGTKAIGLPEYAFAAALAFVDVILVMVIFGGNVNIG